ncbi:MAG TPA: ACT domain-containing protein, partial [Kofleriaceae bacterium]|nr:ACT domain-containing protein [Kofleriaceae bacterium]
VEIHDPLMVGTVGFDLGVMQILAHHQVSYIVKATNANSISHIMWEKAATPELIAELRARYDTVAVVPAAVVSVIGSNLAIPGVLARAAQVLADNQINVICVSQSLRQINMQFVIARADYRQAIVALNRALCLEGTRRNDSSAA